MHAIPFQFHAVSCVPFHSFLCLLLLLPFSPPSLTCKITMKTVHCTLTRFGSPHLLKPN
ncbi:hypothetical protein GLYMA_13G048166v4 [Glycine max]|nr:hypothetical protein GLYMA_13G048166v4 [Glycine max]KAH1099893.1 hypothetical protein GYH30_035166 [Glycine max]